MLVVHRLLASVMALGCLGAATQIGAQTAAAEPGEDPMLTALVEEALANNPDVAGAREAETAAAARPPQARSLPNPMFAVSLTNDGWSPSLGSRDMSTLAFMGSQDLPFPGKRQLRADISSREADQVSQQVQRVRLSITAAVKRAYYGLMLDRDQLALVREQEEIWKQIEGVARARYVVGQGVQQDVLRVQVEVTRTEQLRTEQVAAIEIRVAELNRLLGRPTQSAVETQALLTLRPNDRTLDDFIESLSGMSPELKSAEIGAEKGSLAVSLARQEFKPDFSVQAGYMNRGGLDPMWQAGVGVSLPLYRKRLSSGLAEAEAQERSSQRLVESIRLQLRFRTQERLTQLKATEKVAELYGEGIVPQDRMSVDAAIANYQTGKLPFIAVLEALTTLYNDRSTHLALVANHARIRVSLEEASLEDTSAMGSAGMAAVGGSSLGAAGAKPGGSSMSGGPMAKQ